MKKVVSKIITVLLVIAMLIPSAAMMYSSAAIENFDVELAFNNIFVFDKWASNKLSSTVINYVTPITDKDNDGLELDIPNGSFRFTKFDMDSLEFYTAFSMDAANPVANVNYYMMEVRPNTTYTFFYHVTGTVASFTPFVFFYTEQNLYHSLTAQSATQYGNNCFEFTTPENVTSIQIRFTIGDNSTNRPGVSSVYADVKNIAICEYSAAKDNTNAADKVNNLFDFDEWEYNKNSNSMADWAGYNQGTLTTDKANKSITLTTNNVSTFLFTNFTYYGMDPAFSTQPPATQFASIEVEPNSTYSCAYYLTDCNFPVGNFWVYIAEYKQDGSFITYGNPYVPSKIGENSFTFTTKENTSRVLVVFAINHTASTEIWSATFKDIAVCATEKQTVPSFRDINGHAHRKSYTYSSGNTYGNLPTPTYIPEGYVFAGWYTGLNGTGTHITENTPVAYTSYTVYPKYEPQVDALSIKAMPVKTQYSVGERVNPTGLVLETTIGGVTHTIESGYYCTPEYLTTAGTQTVTAHYGGKTATYTVNVSQSLSKTVVVNGANTAVSVTNNNYTFSDTVANSDFHRYKLTYYSDSYVEGIITYGDNSTEQFFLEPSANFDDGNGEFTSFVDGYLKKHVNEKMKMSKVTSTAKKGIKSISFTLLDNTAGTFDLLSVTTEKRADMPTTMTSESTVAANTIKHFQNDEYKVGIDILNGGAVYQLYLLNSDIVSRVYTIGGKDVTKVDYRYKLDAAYGTKYKSESTNVNLINCYDNGRELQQSYYGTGEKPYEQGYYNSADWNYNPVQAGNVVGEASKVIDYEIGEDYIYIKARPLDWAKWSDEWATNNPGVTNTQKPGEVYEPIHGDDYVTDTYIEAKYVFEDGLIKTYCRMVDYSGLPSAQTTQELPAFYTIEPLNQYVYNNVTAENAWQEENLVYDSEPEFWGVTQDYIKNCYPNGFSANKNTAENWAAFMASQDTDSFGIGLYSPEVTDFYYGVYPPKHSGASADNALYRHAMTLDPATEVNTSYIAPIGVREFSSYTPTEYEFYISTGTVSDIRNSFGALGGMECSHKNTHSVHKAATCTEEGFDKIICDDCGEEISVTVLPVAEHSYETITTKPTCTAEGTVINRCTACGYEYVSGTIASLGHSGLFWSVAKAPTTTSDGVMNQVCQGCNEVVNTKTIPALIGDGSVSVDAQTRIITGFASGPASVDNYLSAANGYTLNCDSDKIGTGAAITLTDGADVTISYVAVVFGDVNGDGWHDGEDAVIVTCIASGMLTKDDVSEAVWMAADCNHDGSIDRLDVALLNKAGTLLASVDQSKSAEELEATSTAYVEYLALIDQSPEIEIDEDITTPDVNEDAEAGGTTQPDFIAIAVTIFDFIKNLLITLLSFIIG